MRRAILCLVVWLIVLATCVGIVPSVVAQQAPAPGTYQVPKEWTVQSDRERATLTDPAKNATVYLMVYRDKREPLQVCVDYVSEQIKDKSSHYDVLSKKMFSYSTAEVARMEVDIKAKGRRARKEWVVGVPVTGGTLLIVAKMPAARTKEYEPVVDRIAKSVLPNVETKWHPVTNDVLGLRLMVAPLWNVKPEPKDNHTNSPEMEITKADARLAVYSRQGKRSAKENLDELETGVKARSKSYEKLAEKQQSIAGVWGTRVEMKTTSAEGVAIRESVVVFSRDNRSYIVKASAPENQFEQYAADLTSMINSVAPTPPKIK